MRNGTPPAGRWLGDVGLVEGEKLFRKDVRNAVSGRGCCVNDKTPKGVIPRGLALYRNRRNLRIEFWLPEQDLNHARGGFRPQASTCSPPQAD